MSFWISFSSCDDLPFLLLPQSLWTKLIFFCSEMTAAHTPSHDPVGMQSVIFCHICFVIFVFCCMFMSYSDHYHIGRRHFHKGGPHYAKKKQIKSCSCKWERCRVQNVNHEILGASLCGNHNRCPFLLLLCIFGRLPKRVIDYQRYHTASKHLAAWPEATARLELCRGLLPLHKQRWNEDHKLGSLCLMLHTFNSDKTETCVQFTQPFLSVFLFVQSFNFRQHTVSLRCGIWMCRSLL